MIEEITIKFGMELKPTQASWKSQLYTFNCFFKLILFLNVILFHIFSAYWHDQHEDLLSFFLC